MDKLETMLSASGAYVVIYQAPHGTKGAVFGSAQDVLCLIRAQFEADNELGRLLRWACADLVNDRLTQDAVQTREID